MGTPNKPDDATSAQERPQDASLRAAGTLLRGDAPETPQQPAASSPKNAQKRPILTDEQVEIILQADDANLLKKVKSGKVLTKSERLRLEAIRSGKAIAVEFCNTIVELADCISVSRKTIQRWRKVEGSPEPRADGRWHVPSWFAFKKTRPAGEEENDEDTVNATQAKAHQILLQNERLEMRILAEKGELIPKVVAQQVYSKLIINAKSRCFGSVSRFVTLARMAENPVNAAEEIRKELTLIFKALEDGEWLK